MARAPVHPGRRAERVLIDGITTQIAPHRDLRIGEEERSASFPCCSSKGRSLRLADRKGPFHLTSGFRFGGLAANLHLQFGIAEAWPPRLGTLARAMAFRPKRFR